MCEFPCALLLTTHHCKAWAQVEASTKIVFRHLAGACYCGCVEQMEPEQIELLAAMTDVVVQL